MKTSPWIAVEDYCACRTFEGGDPNKISDRIAFIEKTPRVRIEETEEPFDHYVDSHKWKYVRKGSGGSGDAEAQGIYGFYPPSREWCDEELVKMGWILG